MGVAVFGHRGACGYLPENTMPSFELAFDLGADAIEFDVVLTGDSVPVILHDIDLTKTTNVSEQKDFPLQVSQLSYDQLATLRVIERYPEVRRDSQLHSGKYAIPSLAEVLANPKFNNRHLILELKDGEYLGSVGLDLVSAVEAVLSASDWLVRGLKITIESFEFSQLQKAKNQIAGPIEYVFLCAPETLPAGHHELSDDLLSAIASEFHGLSMAIPMLWVNDIVARAKRLGLKVFAYTARVETAEGTVDQWFARLIGSGVDGIFADQPDLLVKRVRELA